MYNYGDDVYILDSGYKGSDNITIIKREFNGYTNQLKKSISVMGKSSITVQSWAVFKTVEEATAFAVAYLIYTKELNNTINENSNINNLYEELEKTYPELILKYVSKVVSE